MEKAELEKINEAFWFNESRCQTMGIPAERIKEVAMIATFLDMQSYMSDRKSSYIRSEMLLHSLGCDSFADISGWKKVHSEEGEFYMLRVKGRFAAVPSDFSDDDLLDLAISMKERGLVFPQIA